MRTRTDLIEIPESEKLDTSWEVVARDPETSPDILEVLSWRDKGYFAPLVAANANTPKDVLFRLSFRHPKEVAGNPVIPLLILEDPGFLAKFGPHHIEAFTRDECPKCFWDRLLKMTAQDVYEVLDGWNVDTEAKKGNGISMCEMMALHGEQHFYAVLKDVLRPIKERKSKPPHTWQQCLEYSLKPDVLFFISLGHDEPYHVGVCQGADRVREFLDRFINHSG